MTTPAEGESRAAGGAIPKGGLFKLCDPRPRTAFLLARHHAQTLWIWKRLYWVLKLTSWRSGLLSYLISLRTDNVFAPLRQFSHNVYLVCSFSHRVNWGTWSHQVPGPENLRKCGSLWKKFWLILHAIKAKPLICTYNIVDWYIWDGTRLIWNSLGSFSIFTVGLFLFASTVFR